LLTRLGWFVFGLLVLIIICATVCLYHIKQAGASDEQTIEEIRVHELIEYHGLYDDKIDIHWDGTEWFQRKGKWCRFDKKGA